MLNKKILLVAAVLGAVVACSVGKEQKSESTAPAPGTSTVKAEKDRKPAPAFALKDADGKTVTLADYKGKVVLLNFWATWCAPCKVEIPWFETFQKQYKDQGLVVLGVSLDEEGWKVVKPYLDRTKIEYRILMGDATIDQAYGPIEALPTSFLIDRTGHIAAAHSSLVDKAEVEGEIRDLLRVSSGARTGAGSVTELAAN